MENLILKVVEQAPNLIVLVAVLYWFMQRLQEQIAENRQTVERLYSLLERLIERLDDDTGQ